MDQEVLENREGEATPQSWSDWALGVLIVTAMGILYGLAGRFGEPTWRF